MSAGGRTIWSLVPVLLSCMGWVTAAPQHPTDATLAVPSLVGEGILSTRDDEFGGTLTPDGKTLYFSKSVPRSYLYTICVSHLSNGRWSTPEIVDFSGQYRDFDPVLAPDGRKMLFASDRPVDSKPKHDYDIWMVERTATGWSVPVNLGAPINTEHNEHFASIASSGTIYFSSDRPGALGGEGDSDTYRARRVDGKYVEAEHLPEAVNSPAFELDCVIAPDESFLLVGAIGRQDGYGNYDIYVSFNRDGAWAPSKNLGPIVNTTARDYSPRISPDGRYLFFTSERDFASTPPTQPRIYRDLVKDLRSTLNGSGNIYRIELAAVGLSLVR